MIVTLFLLCASLVGPLTQTATVNVTGVWTMTADTPVRVAVTEDVTFSQDGEALKVTMSGPPPDDRPFEQGTSSGQGTVKGDRIEWVQTIRTRNSDLHATFKGKIDGDKMSGELRWSDDSAPLAWSAVRKK